MLYIPPEFDFRAYTKREASLLKDLHTYGLIKGAYFLIRFTDAEEGNCTHLLVHRKHSLALYSRLRVWFRGVEDKLVSMTYDDFETRLEQSWSKRKRSKSLGEHV